jgi:hypothetical protein
MLIRFFPKNFPHCKETLNAKIFNWFNNGTSGSLDRQNQKAKNKCRKFISLLYKKKNN